MPSFVLLNQNTTEYSQASENGMEALELDTPTETVSVPENSPPSENLTADL